MEFASNLNYELFDVDGKQGIRVAYNDKFYDVCGS